MSGASTSGPRKRQRLDYSGIRRNLFAAMTGAAAAAPMEVDPGPLGGNSQLRYRSVSFNLGASHPTKRKLDKIDHEKQVLSYRCYGGSQWGNLRNVLMHFNGTAGTTSNVSIPANIPIVNANVGSGGTTFVQAPMFFINVTRRPNVVDASGTINNSADIFVPSSSQATTAVTLDQGANQATGTWTGFRYYNGNKADGSGVEQKWTHYYTTRGPTSVAGCPHVKGILDAVSFKLEAWGQAKRPTRYNVALVQFDEKVAPEFNSRGDPELSLSYASSTDAAQFWNELIRGKCYHPWSTGYGPMKYLKILAQDSFDIEPTNNTDADSDPQCVMKNYYFRLNRMCHFSWGSDNASDPVTTGKGININAADHLHADVDPKARLYIMVSATNFKQVNVNAADFVMDKDYVPSCSFDLKTYWTLAT